MKGNIRLFRALVVVVVALTLNVVFPASSFAGGYPPPGQAPAYMSGMYSSGAAGYPSPGQAPGYMTGMYSSGAAGYPSSCVRSIYFVRRGDNLFRIGLRFGLSPLRLAVFNGLRNPNFIFAGMRLAIPCSSRPVPPPPVGQSMVVMRNLAFSPATITIRVGQTVTWRNDDSTQHTTTSGSCSGNVCSPMPGWDSGILNRGQSFSHTFNTAGTFHYYCRVHGAMMQGSVVVLQ